ncbi:xanthine dehydrogenase family protein subunit M [Pusillimonas sp. DMV24BSW_D]|uniref:FAD binding domain-containing protein n=1 Tax=Neopusillimonas aestuarii TaxID=2716226 RepID=UPI001407A0FF|nr:xanthine dehydrogenase family protein subunit M [Pusillimonas sp. DMV24BSW_D]QIM49024.1 xanthine dehydrogenase family protein subunit M [Pusillimonas sp. DMV24BSW_D]
MHDFEYLEPTTAQDACKMLADFGEDSRIIAGGTALLLGMRQRMLSPSHLISLGKLDNLRKIEFEEGVGLQIGALVRHADIARSEVINQHFPILASMASRLANPQVRNAGTIGGNLCYGDPATDPPGCLLALGAQIVVMGPKGERCLAIDDFLVDYFQTALEPDEIVTHILIPALPDDVLGSYTRFLRTPAEHRPLVNIALLAQTADRRTCGQIRIAMGASTTTATRLNKAEAYLEGKTITTEVCAQAADLAVQDLSTISDSRGSAEYRLEMTRVVLRRSLGALFNLDQQ